MRQSILLPLAILWSTVSANADTTSWLGDFSSSWTLKDNWTAGVPQNGDTVNIGGVTSGHSNPSASSNVSLANAIINLDSGADPAFNGGLTLGENSELNVDPGAFMFTSFLDAGDATTTLNLIGGGIDLGGMFTIANSGSTTIASNISGSSGAITKYGSGTLVLAGNNSFNGGLTVNNGTLQFSSGPNLGGLDNSITFNGGVLRKTTSGNVVIPMTVNPGGVIFDVPFDVGFGYFASISGTGALTKENDGSLTLAAPNSYTGGTNIGTGALIIGGADSDDVISDFGFVSIDHDGVLIVNSSERIGGLTGFGFVELNDHLTVNAGHQTTSYGGFVSGTANLTKDGIGKLTLTNDNTATGAYIVNNGTLELTGQNTPLGTINVNGNSTLIIAGNDATNILPNSTIHLATSNATLRVDSAEDIGTVTGVGEVLLNDTLTLNNGALDSSFDGAFEGTGTLLKDGSGEFHFNGLGEHSGPTIVHAGHLRIDSGGHLKQSTLTIEAGGTLNLNSGGAATAAAVNVTGGTLNVNNNGNLVAGPIDVTSGSIVIHSDGDATADSVAGSGTIQINAGGDLTLNGGDLTWAKSGSSTIAGSIHGTGGIAKFGPTTSILLLTGVNTYTGDTLISSGTLTLAGPDATDILDETGVINLSSSFGTLSVAEEEDIGPLAGFGTVNMIEDLTVVSHTSSTFQGDFDGGGTLIKTGSETLTVGPDAQLDHGGSVEVQAGTLVVETAAAYTGSTVITGGVLLANNATGSATGAGPVQVEGSGTLGGFGSVGGEVTIAAGGTISPGNDVGTLNVGSLVLESSSTFAVELFADGGMPGIDFDQLAVSGDATLGGSLAIELVGGFAPSAIDTFTVLISTNLGNSFENVANRARLDTVDGVGSFLVSYDSLTNDVVLSDFSPTLAGDFDLDSDVDGADFLKWQRDPSVGPLSDWKHNYGSQAAVGLAPVPEPTSAALAMVALCFVGSFRRC